MSQRINQRTPTIDRRRVLQGIAAASVASVAGCLSDDDNGDGPEIEDALERNEVDLADIQEGGRLEFAIPRSSIADYDPAESSAADDTTVFSSVFDGLLTTNTQGETELWMAAEYDAVESYDVGTEDYADYMIEVEPAEVDEGTPIFDLEDENNLVLRQHPDDLPAEEGETVRILTRDEAADAALDGVFGTKVEGRLHEGIEFSNGEELTAENIVRSYDRFVGSSNQGQVFDSFLHAEATDGPDGYEFELYAQEADAAAFLELPPIEIFPSDHFDIPAGDLEPRDGGEVPVGTGPYQIEEFDEGSQLLLTRQDNYWVEEVGLENIPWWDGPDEFPEGPVIDEINIRFVEESGQRSAALEDGDVDIAYELPSDARNNFHSSDDYVVSAAEGTGFKFMQFPLEETEEGGAFAEPEIRKAVSALIPRQEIVDIVEQGWGDPAQAPIPRPASGMGSMQDYDDLIEEDWAYNIEPDVDRAADLIEESNQEAPVEVVIETNADDDERIDKMQLVVDQLNRTDLFDASLETPAALGDWIPDLYSDDARVDSGERNAAAVIGLATGFDPHGYIEAIHDPDNYNGCCNFFFPDGTFPDEFVDQLRGCRYGTDVSADPDTRRQAYDEFWPEHVDLSANVIVDYSLTTGTASNEVVGFNVHPSTQSLLAYALYSPLDEQIMYIDR